MIFEILYFKQYNPHIIFIDPNVELSSPSLISKYAVLYLTVIDLPVILFIIYYHI